METPRLRIYRKDKFWRISMWIERPGNAPGRVRGFKICPMGERTVCYSDGSSETIQSCYECKFAMASAPFCGVEWDEKLDNTIPIPRFTWSTERVSILRDRVAACTNIEDAYFQVMEWLGENQQLLPEEGFSSL